MDKDKVDPRLLYKIQQKQHERENTFAKLRKEYILDELANNIVELQVESLLNKLKSGDFTATQVLRAYTAKALEVTGKFNCVTEFVPQAEQWAAALDAKKGACGPLHGLPVALKDDHDVEGMDSTLGFAKNLYKPATKSAALVKVLVELGAVPFCKTNVPQSLFSGAGDNPIFGTTTNCRNSAMSSGGSSSGSACIVGAGGAPFATGSDVAGSLRNPSHFNGVCTVRPTCNRLSGKGVVQCIPKLVGLIGVPGIIAPDVVTLVLVWRAITWDGIQNKYDPLAVPIPWNEQLFASPSKLRIGYFTTLQFTPAFEDTQKTVIAAKTALEAGGHYLVPFEMPDSFRYVKLINDLLLADHGWGLEESFAGEPISPCVQSLVDYVRLSANDQRNMEIVNKRENVTVKGGVGIVTGGDLWNLIHEQKEIQRDILERMDKAGIDIILSPTWPCPAVKREAFSISGAAYHAIWNLVDFPAGVIPFGVESQSGFKSYDDQNDPLLNSIVEAVSESAGMPISVQLIARPFKEELVLKAMIELEKCKLQK